MTAAARTRISRVRMKHGGADVRVIYSRAEDTVCRRNVRAWADSVLGRETPPDAFYAVAFHRIPTVPTDYDATISWGSDHVAFQCDLLPLLAAESYRRQLAAQTAEAAVMRNLGYVQDDDPDSAA